jgi:hypothetical protein
MELFQDKRVWLGGGALVAVLIAAISWFVVISPELSAASSLRTETSDAELQNVATQSQVTRLRLQSENLGELTTGLNAALQALPKASGLPAFTRQLNAQAESNHVAVTSIVTGAVSGVNADGTTTAPGTTPTTDTTGTTPAAGTTPAVSAAGGIYAIPVTVISSGSLANELAFLKAIQTLGPRRALVTSTLFAPDAPVATAPIDKATTVTAQLLVFSAP